DLRAVLLDGPLPLEDAVEYLLQACDAVAEAHRAGIVHRDLKPANAFLTSRSDGSPCIKVLDFGIAKISDPSAAELTHEGMVGSLKYMSPEQILRSKTVDARTDIWALGMIAYEFVTAKPAFSATSQVDLISAIMEDEPAPPSVLRHDLSPAIEAIVLKCLRKNRQERFQSVDEIADALREAVGLPPANVPRIRAPMASISAVTTPPPAVVVEEKTQRGFGVTDDPNVRTRTLRKPLMAGGAVAAVGSVLMLAVALRRPSDRPPPIEVPVFGAAAAIPVEPMAIPSAMSAQPDLAESIAPAIEPSAEVVMPNAVPDKPRADARGPAVNRGSGVSAEAPPKEAPGAAVEAPASSASGPPPMDVPVKPETTAAPLPAKTETKTEVKNDRGVGLEFD
ncbi:MAG TPA: protein kinase, partial [Polyangium sp.]|nr:protein kinase [Polyangium sp.]